MEWLKNHRVLRRAGKRHPTKSGLGRKPGKPPEQSLKLTTYYTDYGASVPFQTSEALPEDQKGGLSSKLLTYR